jgi:hypothetical protein
MKLATRSNVLSSYSALRCYLYELSIVGADDKTAETEISNNCFKPFVTNPKRVKFYAPSKSTSGHNPNVLWNKKVAVPNQNLIRARRTTDLWRKDILQHFIATNLCIKVSASISYVDGIIVYSLLLLFMQLVVRITALLLLLTILSQRSCDNLLPCFLVWAIRAGIFRPA